MAVVEQAGKLSGFFFFASPLSLVLTLPAETDENTELPQQRSSTFNLVQIYDVNKGKFSLASCRGMKWRACKDIK